MIDDTGNSDGTWTLIEPFNKGALVETRLQSHWAAQALAAVGGSLARPVADDSHTSLTWCSSAATLTCAPTADGVSASLALVERRLTLDGGEPSARALELAGRPLSDVLTWTAEQIAELSHRSDIALNRPTYDMPDHAVGDGAPFANPDPTVSTVVAAWFSNAAMLLETMRAENPRASAIRCWPHHFDLASLIALEAESGAAESGRSVGIGMTPGDTSYPEPYFYVTPWPYPETKVLPDLPGGAHWHTDSWLGAVLPSSALVALATPSEQSELALAFARSALSSAFDLARQGPLSRS